MKATLQLRIARPTRNQKQRHRHFALFSSSTVTTLVFASACVSAPPFGAERRPAEIKTLAEDIARVSCDDRQTARSLIEQKEVVPTLIFHFGKKKYLEGNVSARSIPSEVWEKYIQGKSPLIKQAPFRQGIYGCTHPYDCDNYADYEDPWLMAIQLKPECRKPEAVASLFGLLSDARTFKTPEIRRRLESCYPNPTKLEYPKSVKAIDGAKSPRTDCENALEDFLDANRIKTVHDGITIRSWYIRDRNCIDTIYGTPSEILGLFKQTPTGAPYLCKEKVIMADGHEKEMVMGGNGVERVRQAALKASGTGN